MAGLEIDMEFHHMHAFVDSLQPLSHYKDLETTYNKFSDAYVNQCKLDVPKGAEAWTKITGAAAKPEEFVPAGQDLVEQLIAGVGFRVTGECTVGRTRSLVITSKDPRGAKFVVSTVEGEEGSPKKAKGADLDHFSKAHIDTYYGASKAEGGRPGVAILAFESSKVTEIKANYESKHKALVRSFHSYGEGADTFDILECYAYYKPDGSKKADETTLLRFIHRGGNRKAEVLPGVHTVEAAYPCDAMEAYSDHWVSNVVNRNEFLGTLEDVLGFTPKVDFNAGVVAAGEAIIESTVTGNTPGIEFKDASDIMTNQSQIYLPINNALSEVGHVHLFLEELGQGIQHLASRVTDLPNFINRTNNYRMMTGKGFNFLKIPRSYYGYLTKASLEAAGVPGAVAEDAVCKLKASGVASKTGIIDMDVTDEKVAAAGVDEAHLAAICKVTKLARYNNMYKMLGDTFDEAMYLKIVKNNILVDIQANDVLFQIFTGNILQRKTGQEAPFLEFIQRVCSRQKGCDGKVKPIRPGCGGFGIRNFLTLFLSIEVSKAMVKQDEAEAKGDARDAELAEKQVLTFTEQLDLSNPILTVISDAMTAEADALILAECGETPEIKAAAQADAAKYNAVKDQGQKDLQALSDKYKAIMRELRSQK